MGFIYLGFLQGQDKVVMIQVFNMKSYFEVQIDDRPHLKTFPVKMSLNKSRLFLLVNHYAIKDE